MGIPEVQAAGLLALMGVFDLIGTTLSGWLTDRFDPRKLLGVYYGMRGLSLIYLPYSGFSATSLTLFAVLYGLDWIATVPPTLRLSNEAFGDRSGPIVFGWIVAGHQVGAATAAFFGGAMRELQGDYELAFHDRRHDGDHRRGAVDADRKGPSRERAARRASRVTTDAQPSAWPISDGRDRLPVPQPICDQLDALPIVLSVKGLQVRCVGAHVTPDVRAFTFGRVSARVVKYPAARSADSSLISPVPSNCGQFGSSGRSPFQ